MSREYRSRMASVRIPQAFRRARWIGSKQRRLARDQVYLVVRSHRLLERMLEAGGWTGADAGRAVWLALAALQGADVGRVGERFGAFVFGACRDPEGVLAGLDEVTRREVMGSLPRWVAERIDDAFVMACAERAPVTLRVNLKKTRRDAVVDALASLGASPGRWSPTAVHLDTPTNLHGTRAFERGAFEVQDEGSQLIAELVSPLEGQVVVDFCAGGGGKSLAVAAMAPPGVRLHLHDVRERSLDQAMRRAKRAGVRLRRGLPTSADVVLVDAPCTGSGTLRRDPARRWRLTPQDLDEMVALQREVLARAQALVRPGGRLIYATCSVLVEENEGQAAWFAANHRAFSPRPIEDWFGPARALVLGGEVLRLSPQTHGTDGFFAAVFERG